MAENMRSCSRAKLDKHKRLLTTSTGNTDMSKSILTTLGSLKMQYSPIRLVGDGGVDAGKIPEASNPSSNGDSKDGQKRKLEC